MGVTRRGIVVAGAGIVAGGGLSIAASEVATAYEADQPLQFYGGHASLLRPDPTEPVAHSSRIVWSAAVSQKAIALTFDDGPKPNWTPEVVQILDDAGVPGTFFCRGDHVLAHGELLRKALGRHEIGNHSYSHPDLARLDFKAARAQLARCNDAIWTTFKVRPTVFRPPYGHVSGAAVAAAASLGMTIVAWSAQFRESAFKKNPDGIVDDAHSLARPGTIMLGHDTGPTDRLIAIDHLGAFIDRLSREGWSFHTVSGLLALEV